MHLLGLVHEERGAHLQPCSHPTGLACSACTWYELQHTIARHSAAQPTHCVAGDQKPASKLPRALSAASTYNTTLAATQLPTLYPSTPARNCKPAQASSHSALSHLACDRCCRHAPQEACPAFQHAAALQAAEQRAAAIHRVLFCLKVRPQSCQTGHTCARHQVKVMNQGAGEG